MEPELKIFIVYCVFMAVIMGTLAYAYTHPKFPKVEVVYDCRMLMGGWHPDVPEPVLAQCRKLVKE
jgi:hypothetical protein